jgi:diaminopimelate epimerase
MLLRFTKMHGLGNDFVVIDSLSQDVLLNADKIRALANRRTGIGCDQLLLIEAPQQPDIDFNYRIFNADGGEVEQCGNGARCLGKYIKDKRLSGKNHLRVSTCNSLLDIQIIDHNTVSVDMGVPVLTPEKIPFVADQQATTYELVHEQGRSTIAAVSMGNPHAVMVVDNVDDAAVDSLGAIIERHAQFPAKVNVGFMQIIDRSTIKLRVFERGVGETQACGSGACAAVVAGRIQSLLDENVTVNLLGGNLNIYWPGENENLTMTGKAAKVFDGKIRL